MEKNVKHIHFIGVGGAGMNGLAEVFLNMGYKISGSDIKSSENTERIKYNKKREKTRSSRILTRPYRAVKPVFLFIFHTV